MRAVSNGGGAGREVAGFSMFWRLRWQVTLDLPHVFGVLIFRKRDGPWAKIPAEKPKIVTKENKTRRGA